MKKFLCLLFLLSLLLVVSACGNKNTDPATNEPTTEEQLPPSTGGDKPSDEAPVVKKVTFKADGVVVDEIEYTVGVTTSITEPEVPAKEHYVGTWENYTLGSDDIVVNARYEIDLAVKGGAMDYVDGNYISTTANTIARIPGMEFTHGTLSVDLLKSRAAEDSGVIFGLSDSDLDRYWEDDGVSYYFFFINVNGAAYLAKSVNGAWIQLGAVVNVTSLNEEDVYPISISMDNGLIKCFVGGECMIKHEDKNPLTGTGVGYRLQESGTKISPVTLTDEVLVDEFETADYAITAGEVSVDNGQYTTTANNTLAFAKDLVMEDNVKYSIEYTPNSAHDGGLVFGLENNGSYRFFEDQNSGIYYYMLMINFDGVIIFTRLDGRDGATMWNPLFDNSNIHIPEI